MGFRDEREAQRHRIACIESDLAITRTGLESAEREVAELRRKVVRLDAVEAENAALCRAGRPARWRALAAVAGGAFVVSMLVAVIVSNRADLNRTALESASARAELVGERARRIAAERLAEAAARVPFAERHVEPRPTTDAVRAAAILGADMGSDPLTTIVRSAR